MQTTLFKGNTKLFIIKIAYKIKDVQHQRFDQTQGSSTHTYNC